jgi:hypothetical protein
MVFIYSRSNIQVIPRLGTLGWTLAIIGLWCTLGKDKTNIHALSGIQTRDPVYEYSRPTPQTARKTAGLFISRLT